MKTIRWIQNVTAAVAMIVAIGLVDKIEVSFKDTCTAGVLIVMAVVMLLERALREERRAE